MTNESMNKNINCFRFLWSNHMQNLVGAGFPFLSGAILFGSVIVTLAINNRK
jgi:hypothetical protein